MEGSGHRRGEFDSLGRRGTWFARRLGEDWAEVEPGIYRLDAGANDMAAIRIASPSVSDSKRDLPGALNPASGEPDRPQPTVAADAAKPQPTRRLFGRRGRVELSKGSNRRERRDG